MTTKLSGKAVLWYFAMFYFLCGVFYSFGETVTPADFPKPDVEIFVEKGVLEWMESDSFITRLSKTESWKDLPLSAPMINLMTLGTRVERDLKIPLGKSFVNEILNSPMEILLWDFFERGKKTAFFTALDIKPGYRHLLQLGQVYAKSIKNSVSVDIDGLKVLKTETSGETLFHLVKGNQLLVANHPDILRYIAITGEKRKIIHPFRDSDFFKNHLREEKGNLKIRVNLLSWLKNFESVLDKSSLHLGLAMTTGQSIRYESVTVIAEPGFDTGRTGSLDSCSQWIPKHPPFAIAGTFPAKYYLKLFWNLPMVQEQKETLGFDMETHLAPLFENRFFLYIDALQTGEAPHVINGVAGFALKDMNPEKRENLIAFVRWIMERETMAMKKDVMAAGKGTKGNKKLDVYRFEAAGLPAFCVSENWLLIGSGYLQLMKSIDVFNKKSPSLSDSKAFTSLRNPLTQDGFFHLFFRPGPFCRNLGEHMTFIATSDINFNALDVKNKILPLLSILENLSPIALVMERTDDRTTLKGKISFGKEGAN